MCSHWSWGFPEPDYFSTVLAAVAAETPIQAQEAAAKAQSHLDEAAGIVGELNEERDRWQRATI